MKPIRYNSMTLGISYDRYSASQNEQEILTPDALNFLFRLDNKFGQRRHELLAAREVRKFERKAGKTLDFLPETKPIREGDWCVAIAPDDLQDRRVEITGPVDRKMIINALNSGAQAFMADFEDSSTPNWGNMVEGQLNLRDAVNRTITFQDKKRNKKYTLVENPAVLLVRPRGLHMSENHMLVDGKPISASFMDFGLYVFHNAKTLMARGSGPYLYIPKLEHYEEAKLWDDVLAFTENDLGLPHASIRTTVLIETLSAAFQMHEFLYAMKERVVGLNCGRWDYIFSFIKQNAYDPAFVLPSREQLGMDRHFLNSYSKLLIETCHQRGAHAMGGMAAAIPIKNDREANQRVLEKIHAGKEREVMNGHDGTWVAHPGLIALGREVFNQHMPGPNQLSRRHENLNITAFDLLDITEGTITMEALETGIDVVLRYLSAWLQGQGCTAINNLMEDAATAEISRTQIWQWIYHKAHLDTGQIVTKSLVEDLIAIALDRLLLDYLSVDTSHFKYLHDAAGILKKLVTDDTLQDFLTTPAYEKILSYEDIH